MLERREHRAIGTADALELALTAAAQRGGLEVVLVVDESGMLVSHSRTNVDLTLLAAVIPIVGRGRAVPRVRRNGQQLEMSVRLIEVDGEELYVAAVGGDLGRRQRELRGIMSATRRILVA